MFLLFSGAFASIFDFWREPNDVDSGDKQHQPQNTRFSQQQARVARYALYRVLLLCWRCAGEGAWT